MTLGNHLGADFLDYLSNKVSFVSSSVDRITPKTTQADVELVQKMGFADSMPVVTEPFTDWVLSGEFPNGRPDWERAGARFVAEIEPYERRKLWFLNGAHSILALVGLARGHTTVFDAIQDTFCKDLVNQWWNDAEKVLDNSELQLDDYKQKLVSRFENRRIEHLLSQIASDSSLKLNVRFTHVVEGLRQQGQISTSAAMVFAFWIDLCLNQQLPTDANHEAITLASQSDEPITQLLKVVSANLAEDLEFVQAITSALEKIQAKNIANIESSTALVE
jgi:fructuronate reductase